MERINRLRRKRLSPHVGVGRSMSAPVGVDPKEESNGLHNYHWHYRVKTKPAFLRRPFFGRNLGSKKSQSVSSLNFRANYQEHSHQYLPRQDEPEPEFIFARRLHPDHRAFSLRRSQEINRGTSPLTGPAKRVSFERSSSEPSGPPSWTSSHGHPSMRRIQSLDSGSHGFFHRRIFSAFSSGLSRIIRSTKDIPASIEEEEEGRQEHHVG